MGLKQASWHAQLSSYREITKRLAHHDVDRLEVGFNNGTFPPNKCSRAVAFDPIAEILAVGMNDGSFIILDENRLRRLRINVVVVLSQWVQDLKFSPLDPILAVSTHDNFIDLWEYEGSNFTMTTGCEAIIVSCPHRLVL